MKRKGINANIKVAKFGGTSLADANQIKKVLAIIQADSELQYIVVSAPGKRHSKDKKITSLLEKWHQLHKNGHSYARVQKIVSNRFSKIVQELGIKLDIHAEMVEIAHWINSGATLDYAISRGEYLMGKIIAIALEYDFVDPATCINFNRQGQHIEDYKQIGKILKGKKAVIPGFYGASQDGFIKTFSRGGSDITGAIIACAVRAAVYENWTDVSGFLMADPRVVERPMKIESMTHREQRELSYMGAGVFHEEAMFPLRNTGTAINIRNTNDPSNSGTLIVADGGQGRKPWVITGVAGRKNFTSIRVEKAIMNRQVGFARKILTILEKNDISFEHIPGGIDTLSIIINDKQLYGKKQKVVREIRKICSPDLIKITSGMAMIAIVGQAMVHRPGIAAIVFTALANEKINVKMINQGSSEISIIIGVKNDDYENAVRAIYEGFVG